VNIKTHLANKGNYGSTRSTNDIKYIVIHYTGNDGDTDENNGKYFANNVVQVSAHYFVDDDSITQSVPDNYVAWHCGGKSYKHKYCRNTNSIGIEICDDVKNGVVYPSAKTIQNALELTVYLMNKYKIPRENVIRHYDVTGKLCPMYWCGNAANEAKWKSEFWNKLPKTATTNNTSGSGAKKMYRIFNATGKQLGAYSLVDNALNDAKKRLLNGEDVKLTVRPK
jgi:N-acetylmuramoyl-L-alanine amidase CwlA